MGFTGLRRTYILLQPDASFEQPNPVQNQWYVVLNTRNAILFFVYARVADTGETIEVRVTKDGVALLGSVAASAGTSYYAEKKGSAQGLSLGTTAYLIGRYAPLEGRQVTVEIRKTTAAGIGLLQCNVTHARRV